MPLPLPFVRAIDAVNPTVGPRPVHWLAVDQLVRTAVDVLQARSFAKFADKREAMASCPREYYRLEVAGSEERGVWVDYVADTGDGFSATFATARCLSGSVDVAADPSDPSAPPVVFEGRHRRADLLVFGGDEVYPVASAAEYEDRLNYPLRLAEALAEYSAALEPAADRAGGGDDAPPVVALPGNHDWYDGLGAFRRNFCESWTVRAASGPPPASPQAQPVPPPAERDDVGGWGAFQSRSYFAVELCPGWWLWAIDSQLDAPIDAEQLSYFRGARELVERDDARIVLCTATPSWLEAQGTQVHRPVADKPLYTLLWFLDRVLGPKERHRVRLVLTGDQHHYARYTPKDVAGDPPFAPELVTCGGGGAFLASTHHLDDHLAFDMQPWPTGNDETRILRYARTASYPSRAASLSLRRRRFLTAAWRNGPTLPALLGAADLWLFLTIVMHTEWSRLTAWQFLPWLGVTAVVLGLYAYTGAKDFDGRIWVQRALAALLALGHLAAHVGVAAAVAAVFSAVGLVGPDGLLPWYGYPAAFVVCGALGMVAFVTYLQFADAIGCHTLEAFSGLRIEGYKCHLRLHATRAGITVHVVGMDTVPRVGRTSEPRTTLPAPHLEDAFSIPRDPPGRCPSEAAAPARATAELSG